MSDKLLQAETAWTLSTFNEKILLEQLPQEVRYDISQDQMIANHVERLIGEHADIRYLCQHLDDNALSLTWTHPYYVESKEVNGGFVGPMEQMKITNIIKKSMFVTIVTLAGFRQRLNQNYNNRTERTELERVTSPEIIKDVEHLIKNERDNKLESVYRVKPHQPQPHQRANREVAPSAGQTPFTPAL